MKPPPFGYAAPTSVGEAIGLLDAHADDEARVLAGGQSLVPLMNFRLAQPGYPRRPQRVDGLDWIGLRRRRVVVGAMVAPGRRRGARPRSRARRRCSPRRSATSRTSPIRHSGTVGGSLAHADPAAELPAVALALDADLTVAGRAGTREIPAARVLPRPVRDRARARRDPRRRCGSRAAGERRRVRGVHPHATADFAVVGVAADARRWTASGRRREPRSP